MKRIEFIAPVEAMRGNLSGRQTLEYPQNDNPAYDAPAGKHYASNYKPRFIGAKRASDGLKYFTVKTKSAINKTAKSTMAMAALGACGAIIGALLADKTSEVYAWVKQSYDGLVQSGLKKSFRAWLSENIIRDLRAKAPIISFYYLFPVPLFNNPFVSGGTAEHNVTISNEVLIKFWPVLANDGLTFQVEGETGICHKHDTFNTIVNGSYNVLDLRVRNVEIEGTPVNNAVVKGIGDDVYALLLDEAFVQGSSTIDGPNAEFTMKLADLEG